MNFFMIVYFLGAILAGVHAMTFLERRHGGGNEEAPSNLIASLVLALFWPIFAILVLLIFTLLLAWTYLTD